MKNKEVIDAFIKHRRASTTNLQSTGKELFSYNTIIAYWDEDWDVVVNATKYSATTSHHLGILLRRLAERETKLKAGRDIPRGSQSFEPNCGLCLTDDNKWKLWI